MDLYFVKLYKEDKAEYYSIDDLIKFILERPNRSLLKIMKVSVTTMPDGSGHSKFLFHVKGLPVEFDF